MSDYHPDAWVIVKITSQEHGVIYKVLAGWYGGFAGSNSWKLSSGIKSVEADDEGYVMPQWSGSTYYCHKNTERMTGYTTQIYLSYVEKLKEAGNGSTIEHVPLTPELVDLLNSQPEDESA